MRRWQGWAGRRRRSCQPDVYLLPRTEDTRLCRATWVCVLIVRVYLLCVSTLCIYTVYLLYVSKSISGHCIVSERTEGGAAQHLIKISSEREWQQEVQEAEEEVAGWCQVWRTGDRSATMAGGAEAHPSSSGGSGHCHSPLFTDSHLQSVQSMQRLCGADMQALETFFCLRQV